MGLWLRMTGRFKGAVNYFESKSKAGGGVEGRGGWGVMGFGGGAVGGRGAGSKHAINILSIRTHYHACTFHFADICVGFQQLRKIRGFPTPPMQTPLSLHPTPPHLTSPLASQPPSRAWTADPLQEFV